MKTRAVFLWVVGAAWTLWLWFIRDEFLEVDEERRFQSEER